MDSVQLRLFLHLKTIVDGPDFCVPHAVVLTDLDYITAFLTRTPTAEWVMDTFARYTAAKGDPLEVVMDHAVYLETTADLPMPDRYVCLFILPPGDDDTSGTSGESYIEIQTLDLE